MASPSWSLKADHVLPPFLLEDVAISTVNPDLGPSSYGKVFSQREDAFAALRHLQSEKKKLGPCSCHYGFCNIWRAANYRGPERVEHEQNVQDVQIDEFMILIQMQEPVTKGCFYTSRDTIVERGFPSAGAARKWLSRWRSGDKSIGGRPYRPSMWKLAISEASERGC